jgi:diguanylate cyclase (GGDEF)-like protein/PAS domain S-box-containing protein
MLGTAQDITSRRRGEAALRESEARFRSLVEASTQAVWITDAHGEVVSDLASWQRYTGLSSEQTRGEGWTAPVHPEDRARVLQRWREACRTGELFDVECRIRRFDGTWRHMHSRAVPVRNEDGSVREWIGMNADISKRKEAEAARSLLAGVVESSHDAIISHDLEGVILSWNRGAEEMFGYRPEEVIGREYRFLTPQSDPQDLVEIRATIERGARIPDLEVLCRHQDGHEVPVSVSLAGLRDEAGRIVGVTAVARDITAQRLAARALRESEGQLVSILNNAAEGMIVVAADGAIERFNLVAQYMFGYDAQEAYRMNLRQLTIELGGAESRSASSAEGACSPHKDLDTGWIRLLLGSRREVTGRRGNGSIFPLEIALSEIATASSTTKFIAVVRDITDRKSWEKRIYTLAYSDSLTGLPNRLLLRDRLEHAIATAQRNSTLVGVLFFDLDHFKAINDSYGHHVGDVLLRELGERAKSCVREIDTVCRLGGDEFVLVLPELREAADAGAVARKILLALSQPYHIEERDLVITPTVGISIFPRDGVDADTLLRNADTAMYHAKESGKNNFRFYEPERAS